MGLLATADAANGVRESSVCTLLGEANNTGMQRSGAGSASARSMKSAHGSTGWALPFNGWRIGTARMR